MDFFPQKISSRFTTRLKNVLKQAEKIAVKKGIVYIGPEHLLYGIISEKVCLGSYILSEQKIKKETLEKFFQFSAKEAKESYNRLSHRATHPHRYTKRLGQTEITDKWQIKLSKESKNVFQKAAIEASRFNHKYIGTEHLTWGIFSQENSPICSFLKKEGVNIKKILKKTEAFLESATRFSELTQSFQSLNIIPPEKVNNLVSETKLQKQFSPVPMKQKEETLALDYFCTDLTEEAEKGIFDPVIAREKEIEQVINVLLRKIKNNPVLIGQPGVGKTAVVQGLAQKIVLGDVPENLYSKRILSLDLAALIAGTIYRGEFEERLKDILVEIKKNPEVILFIDEIHTIIGAGNTSGSLDAANILKPALVSQNFQCIGATTSKEYRRYFRKDSALERRFQPILIEEPDEKQSIKILAGLKPSYEKFHRVLISRQAIETAVRLSQRFIPDRFLPDKAIDVLDEAAAYVKSQNDNQKYLRKIKEITHQKEIISLNKKMSVMKEKYQEALQFKMLEDKLLQEIHFLQKKQKEKNSQKIKKAVTAEDTAKIVSKITGVSVTHCLEKERKNLKNLEQIMAKRLIGQKEAIKELSGVIRRSHSKVSDPERPLGSFVFLGPSGVGKTETARVLANSIYKDPNCLIKIDMTDFIESHTISKLVGAPAGYVGYGEGGKLTEAVKMKPNSIILFDEIEKAHLDISNILLQILEDGELVDAQGEKINFKNTIIIMTSNIGTVDFTREATHLGFSKERKTHSKKIAEKYEQIKKESLEKLKELFRPELLNRIDKVIVFKPLEKKEIKKIVDLQFKKLAERLTREKIKLNFSKAASNFIAEKSFDPNQGARLIRRNIESLIENPLAEKIIEGKIKDGDQVEIEIEKGKIVLKLN